MKKDSSAPTVMVDANDSSHQETDSLSDMRRAAVELAPTPSLPRREESLRSLFDKTRPVWRKREDGTCDCGWSKCPRPGKHADERAPASSGAYAVVTGRKERGGSGVVVIDLDRKPGAADGVHQFAELCGENVFETLRVNTPSGGEHIYFKHPGHGIHIGNGKLASAIDVRGDKASEDGCAYVIGPGSPGYTVDPEDDVPIAPMPEWLLGHLLSRETGKKKGFAPDPIDESHPKWEERIAKAVEACRTMPESKGDGDGGTHLLRLAIRLVRKLELPLDACQQLVEEFFNPRCTTPMGEPYPWSPEEIAHKLEDARDKSDIPCGEAEPMPRLLEMAKPAALRVPSAPVVRSTRKCHKPGHAYKFTPGEVVKTEKELQPATFSELTNAFTRGEHWDGCWQYNEFTQREVCIDPPIKLDAETTGLTDRDIGNIRTVLEFGGVKANKEDIYGAIVSAASAVSFHPVREYLSGLPAPEDTSILDGLARRLFGTEDPMAEVFLRKTLIGAVRRIFEPGCKMDTMLVLYGEQDRKKSTTVEVLFGSEYFKDDLADLSSKDAAIGLQGRWVVEVAELDKTKKANDTLVKAWLSRRIDRYRPPYAKKEIDTPRQCVFVGTTNEQEFQHDATGGRRFWPIHVATKVDTDWLKENRDAIWAAAYSLYLAKEPHWLTDAEERRAEEARQPYTEVDPWHELIEEYCRGKKYVRPADIFKDVLNKGGTDGLSKLDRAIQNRITNTLKRLKCAAPTSAKYVEDGSGKRLRVWEVPADLAKAKPNGKFGKGLPPSPEDRPS